MGRQSQGTRVGLWAGFHVGLCSSLMKSVATPLQMWGVTPNVCGSLKCGRDWYLCWMAEALAQENLIRPDTTLEEGRGTGSGDRGVGDTAGPTAPWRRRRCTRPAQSASVRAALLCARSAGTGRHPSASPPAFWMIPPRVCFP